MDVTTPNDVDTVVEISIGCIPEASLPGPIVMQSDERAIFSFNGYRELPDGGRGDEVRAIVRIPACLVLKFGYPPSEAFAGHPLYQKGLEDFGVYEVLSSSWKLSLENQNRVAFPGFGTFPCRHFIVPFHDSVLEVLCREIQVDYFTGPPSQHLAEMAQWVNSFD